MPGVKVRKGKEKTKVYRWHFLAALIIGYGLYFRFTVGPVLPELPLMLTGLNFPEWFLAAAGLVFMLALAAD